MGNEENDTPTKTPKPPSTQEQPPPSSPATVFHDWASMQAYYNSGGTPPIPPPGFFHSPVASSPQAHPYMWGQHMIPPYGTPPHPYFTMYPHGGTYAHPSMPPGSHPYSPYAMLSPNGAAEASVAATSGKESESKSGEGKKKNRLKRSKGSLGSLNMITGKDNETGKGSEASNGGFSQSGESGGEGSSGGSDANSHNDSQQSGKGSANAGAQNGEAACSVSSGVSQTFPSQGTVTPGAMVVAVPPNSVAAPTTNLHIGMDYWGGPTAPPVATGRAKLPTVQPPGAVVPSTRDGIPSDLWIQDERELKRQRRKQSNRESARRSRLRKQAEYDELAQRVEALKEENALLREQLERTREECDKLSSENASLNENLKNRVGEESRVDGMNGEPEAESQVTANLESTTEREC